MADSNPQFGKKKFGQSIFGPEGATATDDLIYDLDGDFWYRQDLSDIDASLGFAEPAYGSLPVIPPYWWLRPEDVPT